MLPAIYFYDQLLFDTDEVTGIRSDDILPAKFLTSQGPVAKQVPKTVFGFGLVFLSLLALFNLFVLMAIFIALDHPSPRPSPLKGRGRRGLQSFLMN